jgi:hypothetical protein
MRMELQLKLLRVFELAWSAMELMELWIWSRSLLTAESEIAA